MSEIVFDVEKYSDLDITITLRSSETDITNLKLLLDAIVASQLNKFGSKIVLIEAEQKLYQNSEKLLRTIRQNYYID